MIYARGNRLDYDSWAQMGLTAWSYDRILPYFKRSENHFGGASEFHGGDGPLPVTRMNSGHPMHDIFIRAGQQAGYPYNPDFNGSEQRASGITTIISATANAGARRAPISTRCGRGRT